MALPISFPPRPRVFFARLLLPAGADSAALPVLAARALRGFADGYMAVLLPAWLLAIGLGTMEVGIVATATLLGSALATLAVGTWGHRLRPRPLLRGAALLMAATGAGFAGLASFWPLLVVAFVGTLNPSSGDVSLFVPLEHTRLASAAAGHARTALFARYSVLGAFSAATGALAAGLPDWLTTHHLLDLGRLGALRAMFVLYAAIGLLVWRLYAALPDGGAARRTAADPSASTGAGAGAGAGVGADAGAGAGAGTDPRAGTGADAGVVATASSSSPSPSSSSTPLGPSRRVVTRLAALFSIDAFAGGLAVNSLLSLWLLQRFGLTLAQVGAFFFWAGLLNAASQLAAPLVARRIGLLNTMVFTHLPANVCLIAAALVPDRTAALALLLVRTALSQMDVPARTAYVMAVVTPAERPAAASFTAVPRSLASALSPTLGGALFAAGWISAPLVACGLLKIAYDLTLWRACRHVRLDAE